MSFPIGQLAMLALVAVGAANAELDCDSKSPSYFGRDFSAST